MITPFRNHPCSLTLLMPRGSEKGLALNVGSMVIAEEVMLGLLKNGRRTLSQQV